MPTPKRSRISTRSVPDGQSSDDNSEVDQNEVTKPCEENGNPFLSSRIEEKEELQWLNSRLADYIDYIQQHLVSGAIGDLDILKESFKEKFSDLDNVYSRELEALRTNLDRVALQLAETEVKLKTATSDRDETMRELDEARAKEAQTANELAKLSAYSERLEKQIENCKKSQLENDKLVKQYRLLQTQLEQETLQRTELQNRILTLSEQLDFKEKLLASQRESFSTDALQIHVKTMAKQSEKYRKRLRLELDDLRKSLDSQMKDSIAKLEQNAAATLDAERKRASAAEERVKASRQEYNRVMSLLNTRSDELDQCRSELQSLRTQVDRLNSALTTSETNQRMSSEKHRDEITRLIDLLDEKSRECAELAGIKIQLDAEIAMYRSLLESEESRCNLQASERRLTATPLVTRKRKLSEKRFTVDLDEASDCQVSSTPLHCARRFSRPLIGDSSVRISCSSDGPVHFAGADPADGLVRIFNASDEPVSMDRWAIFFGPTSPGAADCIKLYVFTDGHTVQPHSEMHVYLCSSSGEQLTRITPSKKKRVRSIPNLYIVTEAPIWKPYSSCITLQDAEGSVRSVCEIKPISMSTPSTPGVIKRVSARKASLDSFRITCKSESDAYFKVPDTGDAVLYLCNAGEQALDLTGWYIILRTRAREAFHLLDVHKPLAPGSEIPVYLSNLNQKSSTFDKDRAIWLHTDAPLEEHYNSTLTLYDSSDQVRATSTWEQLEAGELDSNFCELEEPPMLRRSNVAGGNDATGLPAINRYRHFMFMTNRNRSKVCSCPFM